MTLDISIYDRLARRMRTAGLRARAVVPFEPPRRRLSSRRLAQHAGFGTLDTVLTTLIDPEHP